MTMPAVSLPPPAISVITPVYNAAQFLRLTLASLEAQDYPHEHIEVLLVDDGATDASAQIIADFIATWAGRARCLRHPNGENRGIVASYRLALQHCQGATVAFLEHDDCWHATKLSTQQAILARWPEVGVTFSDVYCCAADHTIAPRPFRGLLNRPPPQRPFSAFNRLLWGNFILTFSNIMVRRELLTPLDIISQPPGFQDWMILFQLAPRCQFYYCPQTKVYWRQRENSYHQRLSRQPGYRQDRLSIIHRWAPQMPRTGYLRFELARTLYWRLCCLRHRLATRT